jgi:hypothetical protein
MVAPELWPIGRAEPACDGALIVWCFGNHVHSPVLVAAQTPLQMLMFAVSIEKFARITRGYKSGRGESRPTVAGGWGSDLRSVRTVAEMEDLLRELNIDDPARARLE